MLDKFLNLTTKQKTIIVVSAGIIMFILSYIAGYFIGQIYFAD